MTRKTMTRITMTQITINLSRLFMSSVFFAGLTMMTLDAGAAKKPSVLQVGEQAPEVETKMMGTNGKKYSIADKAGKKGTLVLFTCNTCPFVKAWDERITLLGQLAIKNKIGVILINSNDAKWARNGGESLDAMKEKAKEQEYNFPYVIDQGSAVATAFGATKTPEIFLLDEDHKLVYRGAVDDNSYTPSEVESSYLKDALEALGSGKAIPVSETKSIGCSIKFGKPSQI